MSSRFEFDSSAMARIEAAAEELVGKVTEDIATDARSYAPVDTGRLRNSIQTHVDGAHGIVYSDVDYAAYVELGTSKHKAQPYLKPAAFKKRGL